MTFPLMPFSGPQLLGYSVSYLGYIDTETASSGTMSIGAPDGNRWLLFVHARNSATPLTTNGVPVSVNGSPSTMLYDRATTYSDDGQHIKLMMKKWPTGTSATFSNLQTGGPRGARLLVFSVYGAGTLTAGTTYFGNKTITMAGGAPRAINLVGGAGNGGAGLTGVNYSALSDGSVTSMGGVALGATASETYTGNSLVAAIQLSVS